MSRDNMNKQRMMNIDSSVRTIAVNCLQFGDTGKGKVVDLLANWADIIVRGTGGANAGHSVYLNGEPFVFHLIPSGILHDEFGKTNIVGSGAAIDPRIFCEELDLLRAKKKSTQNLMLSLGAKLTLPTQIARDRVGEGAAGAGKIGTTGRGIGPTYSDHALRIGLFVNDLLNRDILAAKVKANVEFSARLLKSYPHEMVKAILHQHHLASGVYYHPTKIFDVDAIVEQYFRYGEWLEEIIDDTDTYVHESLGVSKILLEGAQGSLLDVDYGTRPFVTSSNCTVDGLAKGAGLNRSDVDLALGVFKGFYMTRVGEGPFPTEMGGLKSAKWCSHASRENEEADYSSAQVNSKDSFLQGVALRMRGDEYGATTKRPRRVGWLDLPLLRQALTWGSPDVVLTKLDVLDECSSIKVCTHYKYMGPDYRYGQRLLHNGDVVNKTIVSAEVLKHCQPVYREFPGWQQSIREIRATENLPSELKEILKYVIGETRINPRIISVGPAPDETIFV